MGKASVPKRGRTRPLRSDTQPRGMPTISLGKAAKKAKLKPVNIKKAKLKLKEAKGKTKNEESSSSSAASLRGRRSNAQDNDASTSRPPNEVSDGKGSKKVKIQKELVNRSESPSTTRLSRSSSSNSLLPKASEIKKVSKGNANKGKAASFPTQPAKKGILDFFVKKVSPTSKGSGKKTAPVLKKKTENDVETKRTTSSLNTSPDSVTSGSNQSHLVGSEHSDLNEDENDVELDNDDAFMDVQSEESEASKQHLEGSGLTDSISKSTNGDLSNQKSIPKLTKKNINELFPSDDFGGKRLRSGSPASQKSTRSLSVQRPMAAFASSLRYGTRSDSAVRVLRNGKHSKLKRATVFENKISGTSKKRRVYAGAIKDEDKMDDSRSDFSDEQSSIFSESDSSSFFETFSRMKNNELDDKMDPEEIPGSLSNDEDDAIQGQRFQSPQPERNLKKTCGDNVRNTSPLDSASTAAMDENSLTGSGKASSVLSKSNEILNNLQSDWDSDGEENKDEKDAKVSLSPKEDIGASNELSSNPTLPEIKEKNLNSSSPILKGNDPNKGEKVLESKSPVGDMNSVNLHILDEKQFSESTSPSPSQTSPLSTSATENDPAKNLNQSSASDSSNSQAKSPEPLLIKSNDKNGFSDSVDFVAKRNPRIDFELLRRRTKRSMSFNIDAPEKSQSQRILAIEPSKVHGKAALFWTVKAVREPIIPKSGKSPDKGLRKSDSAESKTTSPIKPMVESVQNDHVSVVAKNSPDAVVTSSSLTVSSSSVKENILVQNPQKQSSSKSPGKETVVGATLKVVKSPNKLVLESPVVGVPDKENSGNVTCKQPLASPDSSLAATLKQSVTSTADKNVAVTFKAGSEVSPSTHVPVNSASNEVICNDVSIATAAKTPIRESSPENDPVAPCLASELNPNTGESARERCISPPHTPIMQNEVELSPDKASYDDGESFSLRLSPTPTKDDGTTVDQPGFITPKKRTSCDDQQPSSVEGKTEATEGADSEGLKDALREDLAEKLPDEEEQESEERNSETLDSFCASDTQQTLQLVVKRFQSSCRPRSRSADCNSSLPYDHEDIWVVKKGDISSVSSGMNGEELAGTSVETGGEKKENELVAGPNDMNEHQQKVGQTMEIQALSLEAGGSSSKFDDKIFNSSTMTIECPDVRVKQPGLLSPRLEADVERLHLKLNDIEKKRREITEEEQSPEKKAIKEWILSSLGLQSVAAAAAAASETARPSKRRSQDGLMPSSGRLKAVIKVSKENKKDKKSERKPLRMVFKNGKPSGFEDFIMQGRNLELDSAFGQESIAAPDALSTTTISSGTDYGVTSIMSLPETASSLPVDADGKPKPGANLVIPEKSSSFSIHPGRLCSDVCSYCFGKFGSLDTPCHVAQLKSRERQMKIMSVETHLALDSCLCDACIRYVDRKANCPSSKPQNPHRKESKSKFEGSMANCSVTGCVQPARHSLRKKWYIKIKKSVMKKCPIDLELAHQHLPLPLCPEHYSYMEYFMVCGLCKRRLSKSHMYNLSNTREINMCLEADGIPARLSDKLFVCKLCRYYATLRVKHPGSHFNLSANQREFFTSYRKRILLCHDIDVSVSGSEDGGADPEIPNESENQDNDVIVLTSTTSSTPSLEETLPKGKRKRAGSNATSSNETDSGEQPKKKSKPSDSSSKSKEKSNGSRARSRELESVPPVTISIAEHSQVVQSRSQKNSKSSKSKQGGNAPAMEWVRKGFPPFYPGEDELALHGKFQFQFDDEPSANRAWEKCTSTLQFDKDTKKLWQELQRPYGSQSSFLRHLVLMERYWRQGELILAPDASAKATSYTRSVQNRLKAYGSTITVKATPEPPQQSPLCAQPSQTVPKVVPDVSRTLEGGTVLTAAAAAAAVTAVHTSGSPVALPSPSNSSAPKEAASSSSILQAPQLKFQVKPQTKSQPSKSVPSTTAVKSQVVQRIPPVLKVAQVAPQSVKPPPKVRVTVKPTPAVMTISPGKPTQPQISANVPSRSLAHHTLPITVPVTAGVTITAEPQGKTSVERFQNQGKAQANQPKPQTHTLTSKSQGTSGSFSLNSHVNMSPWEPSSHTVTSRSQFVPMSAPVVNLTRSISLTAVPSSPPAMPDLHPITSEGVSTTRPNKTSSASLPMSTSSMVVSSSRGSSGGFVSIIPTSPSKVAHSKVPTQPLSKSASITPIYTSQSLPSSVSVTSSATSVSSVSSPVALRNDTPAPAAGNVHVMAGGKSYSLTIMQFKKLQALRKQRHLEQKAKEKVKASPNQKDNLDLVEVLNNDSDSQQSSFPTISAVCSGDQAKAMWNEESHASDFGSNVNVSISRPSVQISSILGAQSVENMPKIPKTLTVTQIKKQSPISKTVSSAGTSLTITRQTCQTPVPPQMSSPALDIFPS